MSEFESVKHSFIGGSTLFIMIGVFYVFLGYGASIINGYLAFLPMFAVLVFAIWMKKKNPLYQMDRAERRNLIKPYQPGWVERHKNPLVFAFFTFMIATVWISLLLGAALIQAINIGVGLPILLYGLASLFISYRIQPKAG